MTTQESKAELREAKRRCLERLADARAKSKAEHEHREYASRMVRVMQNEQRRMSLPDLLNRTLFERRLRAALEAHFETSEQEYFTTDEIIVLVNEMSIAITYQDELLRLLSIDRYLGCTYEGENYWRFPRIEPAPRLNTIPTSTSPSIFDK